MTGPRPSQMAEIAYRAGLASWDIGGPQPVIRQLVALGAIRGEVLDAGCGLGWHAIEAARTGCTVTGIDLSPTAVHRARRNAHDAGATVDFMTADVTQLDYRGKFDTVIDVKLLDNLPDADTRRRYLTGLHRACKPGARIFVFGFGTGAVNGMHNHLVEDLALEAALPATGFRITYIGETTYQLQIQDWRPLCTTCPTSVPNGRIHIPLTEVHAVRIETTK